MLSLLNGMRKAAKQYYKRHKYDQKHITALKQALKTIKISPITEQSHLSEQDIPLIVVARDSEARFPDFLRHYREMGITRFIVIDNNSKDKSVGCLNTQKDVDIWLWKQNYTALKQCAIQQHIVEQYGLLRWYLVVDIDEYFVYSGMEYYKLKNFIYALQRVGEQQVSAPMVDMFSTRPITSEDMSSSLPLDKLCDHFDVKGYSYQHNIMRNIIDIRGGPRVRLFETNGQIPPPPLLSKTPFFYANPNIYFVNSHFLAPNPQPLLWSRAALLHFKFLADAEQAIDLAINEKFHCDNASHYKTYKKNVDLIKSGLKPDDILAPYNGPKSLIDAGLIGTHPWAALPD
ncbi:MAG: glycosyltransferase family 2 protein [Pseudomonadota bacterium]